MQRLDPPGFLDDLTDAQKEQWSATISSWLDQGAAGDPGDNDGPRAQFFNPLSNPPAADAQVAVVAWNAFPRQVKSNSLSDRHRWQRADASRDVQDEYCEWSVERDAAGRILRVTFTCEGPEYWQALAAISPDRVLNLYREFVSPSVTKADLFAGGAYIPRNRFNNGTRTGAMHLIQRSNTLGAEIELAAAATIRRIKDGRELTSAQELIMCSKYGAPGRNSDPFIGEQVNALARQGADVTLNNPVGLYLHEFNPVNWATPDNADPREFWKVVRGRAGYAVRAVFEVPSGAGYTVSDIRIGGRAIEFGAQITDFITIKLEGLATRFGQSTTPPLQGCLGEGIAAPPSSTTLVPFAGRRTVELGDEAAPPSGTPGTTDADVAEALPAELSRQLDLEIGDDGAAPPGLVPYPPLPAEHFVTRHVSGRILAYASPDSTYAVTARLLDSAQRSIVIGIYDFSASYMKDHLKRAMRRGVEVALMLDTNKADDPGLFGELRRLGARCVQAPSSSAGHENAYFGNAHEKIIVIDGQIVMIQSGNWSENSIPFNPVDGMRGERFEFGNRDMGLAVESPDLAALFAELVLRDMRLAEGLPPSAAAAAPPSEAGELFFESAPASVPPRLFQSLTVTPNVPVPITPVVTPENFHPLARDLLRSARTSVRIEQQYIRGNQAAVRELLDSIAAARDDNPELSVRIIVSPKYLFGDKKQKFLQAMEEVGLEFGEHFRFLSTTHFVHCHNKLIVVDGERTLLGSQNWSTTGLLSNREAGLLVEHAGIAGYFSAILDSDWDASADAGPPSADLAADLVGADAFAAGCAVESTVRDYFEV